MVNERWLPIHGYEGLYEASDTGLVRGVDRIVKGRPGQQRAGRMQPGKILVPSLRAKPSPRLQVRLYRDAKRSHKGVGHLVLTAFHGPCPRDMECCHNNGDATDNRLENLRWDTHSANMLDTVRHGTHAGAAKTVCVRGHLIPPDKPKRAQCRTCKREDYYRHRSATKAAA